MQWKFDFVMEVQNDGLGECPARLGMSWCPSLGSWSSQDEDDYDVMSNANGMKDNSTLPLCDTRDSNQFEPWMYAEGQKEVANEDYYSLSGRDILLVEGKK